MLGPCFRRHSWWLTRKADQMADHGASVCLLVLSAAADLLSNRFLMLWQAIWAHALMLLSVHAQMC